jgi:uncharacterized damage-inducible protein DinB
MADADAREMTALTHFLDAQRASVMAIVDGLGEPQLIQPVMPSGWTALGLIEHLAFAERHWFQQVATGTALPLPSPAYDGVDDDESLTTPRSPEVVFACYREQIARSDAVLATISLDSPPQGHGGSGMDDEITDLRWIVLHMIEETARHAGHLDTARELLDGAVGLGPR